MPNTEEEVLNTKEEVLTQSFLGACISIKKDIQDLLKLKL